MPTAGAPLHPGRESAPVSESLSAPEGVCLSPSPGAWASRAAWGAGEGPCLGLRKMPRACMLACLDTSCRGHPLTCQTLSETPAAAEWHGQERQQRACFLLCLHAVLRRPRALPSVSANCGLRGQCCWERPGPPRLVPVMLGDHVVLGRDTQALSCLCSLVSEFLFWGALHTRLDAGLGREAEALVEAEGRPGGCPGSHLGGPGPGCGLGFRGPQGSGPQWTMFH